MAKEVLQPPLARSAGNPKFHGQYAQRRGKALNTLNIVDGRVDPFPMDRYEKFSKQIMIQSKDHGLVRFERRGSQRYVIDEIAEGLSRGITTFIILKARQLGISTELLILDLFWAFENEGLLGVFACHEEAAREKFRAEIDVMLGTLPKGYKVADNKNNSKMLVLKNRSIYRYLVAGQRASTNKMGRSGGTNYLHSTETAFYGSPGDVAALNETLSDLYPHRLYMYESTANGFNHFEEMWQVAKQSPAQKAIFVGWWRDESKEFGERSPYYEMYMPQGVKTELTDRELEGIKAVREQYGVRLNAGQIAWYRHHLENKCHGDQQQMDQENPFVPDDAFQATGSIYFAPRELTRQFKQARVEKMLAYRVKLHEHWSRMELAPLSQKSVELADLKIWEMPSSFGRYTMGVDPAYGSSPENDNTVISVWRCFADLAYQVAEYSTPTTSTYQCAWLMAYLGGLYKDVMVNLEITGPGGEVLKNLQRLRNEAVDMVSPDAEDIRNALKYMREFLYRRADSMGGGVVRQFKTGMETKPQLMGRFKSMVELDMARVRSLICLEEMKKIRVDGGSIEAGGNGHDDRAVSAALAVYAWVEWRMPELKAKQWNYDRAMQIEKQGGEDAADSIVRRFMQARRIHVKDVDTREA